MILFMIFSNYSEQSSDFENGVLNSYDDMINSDKNLPCVGEIERILLWKRQWKKS